MEQNIQQSQQIIIYQTEDGKTRVEVRFEHENVWLTQKLMAELFDTSVPNINMHLKNIFDTDELDKNSVIKEFLITASDGKNIFPTLTAKLKNFYWRKIKLSI